MSEKELTVEEVKALLPSTRVFEIHPDAAYILAYDMNAMSHSQATMMGNTLFNLGMRRVAIVGYDGATTDEPFKFYEVQKEPE
jgi:hypothetical protein